MSEYWAGDPSERRVRNTAKALVSGGGQIALPLVLPNTPSGTRLIIEVLSLRLTGDRISATMKGHAAADWLTRSPDGRGGTLDVRCTLETDDHALIFISMAGVYG